MKLFRSYNKQQGITAIVLFILALIPMLASCSTSSEVSAKSSATPTTPSRSQEASDDANTTDASTATTRPSHNASTAPQASASSTASSGNSANEHRPGRRHGSTAPTATQSPPRREQPTLADLALSSSVCDISDNTILTIVKAQGWEDGPYTTRVTYSKTLDGPWTTYEGVDFPNNTDTAANPMNNWQWPCHEPSGDDPEGYYTLWFTELDSPVRKSEYVTFQVVS